MPAKASVHSTLMLTDTPPSRASLAHTGVGVGFKSVAVAHA